MFFTIIAYFCFPAAAGAGVEVEAPAGAADPGAFVLHPASVVRVNPRILICCLRSCT